MKASISDNNRNRNLSVQPVGLRTRASQRSLGRQVTRPLAAINLYYHPRAMREVYHAYASNRANDRTPVHIPQYLPYSANRMYHCDRRI